MTDPEPYTQMPRPITELCEVCSRNVGTVACPVGGDLPPVMVCEQCEARLEGPDFTLMQRLVATLRRMFRRGK